jgi:serine/threonine protein kinase
LQKHGIGHRDVSLENVLLKDGEVRLMDFGQAVQSHSSDGTPLRFFTMAGKQPYRAPEAFVPTRGYVPARGVARARVDVPLATHNKHSSGIQFLQLRGMQYLCEVNIPDEAKPGTSCDADLMGYTVPPVDVFACGVCLFILCLGVPPWGQAMLSDPHFAHFHRQGENGVPDFMRRYSKSPLSPSLMQLLVEMMRTDPSMRPTVEECLSNSWIQKVAAEYDDSADVIMSEDACDGMEEDPFANGVVVDFEDAKVGEIVAGIIAAAVVRSMPASVEGEFVADLLRDAFDNFDTKSQFHCGAPVAAPRTHIRAISCAGG